MTNGNDKGGQQPTEDHESTSPKAPGFGEGSGGPTTKRARESDHSEARDS